MNSESSVSKLKGGDKIKLKWPLVDGRLKTFMATVRNVKKAKEKNGSLFKYKILFDDGDKRTTRLKDGEYEILKTEKKRKLASSTNLTNKKDNKRRKISTEDEVGVAAGNEFSSELKEVKRQIVEVERKLERAETRLEKVEEDGNEETINFYRKMVIQLRRKDVELRKEKNKLIPESTAANVPIKREKLTGEEKDLFTYFRNNPEPSCFGFTFELPEGLVFPFMTKEALQNKMFVRPCFERIKSIIENRLDTVDKNGVIFTGPQGNGKSWCSLFLLWNFVHQKRTVVYESCEDNVTYVIKSNGDMYSKSGSADKISVPELKDRNAIYIFDATAKAYREPAASKAFLIVTSSCNDRNYAQSKRRPGILRCCIPSYSREELENICDYFDVSVEEVRRRCLEIGPSIRYILVNDFNSSKTQTEMVAKRVKADDLDRYIDDMQTVSGDDSDISACLLVAIAEELQFEDPNKAYERFNVKWKFASKKLAEIVVKKGEKCCFI